MYRILHAGLALLLLPALCAAPAARADTPFTFLTGNTDRSGAVWITTNGNQAQASYEYVYAGQYQIQLGAGAQARSLYAYCVDVNHDIFDGDQTTSTLKNFTDPLTGFATADYNHASALHTRQQNAAAAAYLLDTYLNHNISADKAVNVGLSLWDIVNDGGDGLSQGDLRAWVDSATQTDVSGLEQEAYTHPAQHGVTWVSNPKLNQPGDTRYQDYGIHASDYGALDALATPVPEGSTFVGLGSLLALGGLAAVIRRSGSRKSSARVG